MSRPLGQALPIDYAVLLYATHGDRTRLLPEELRQAATWMPDELTHAPHCRTSTGILELVRVDLGGSPQHVARKAAIDCSRRMDVPEFRQLVTSSRFQLVVLTTTSSKARLIRQAVESMQWEHDVRLHLAMIPRLTQLQLRSAYCGTQKTTLNVTVCSLAGSPMTVHHFSFPERSSKNTPIFSATADREKPLGA